MHSPTLCWHPNSCSFLSHRLNIINTICQHHQISLYKRFNYKPNPVVKMEPISPTTSGIQAIKVLFVIHSKVNALDVLGPLEVLSQALHKPSDPCKYYHESPWISQWSPYILPKVIFTDICDITATKAFEVLFCGAAQHVKATNGMIFETHLSFDEALKRLGEFSILIIPGGDTDAIIKNKEQPLGIAKAYADVQMKNPHKERTLMAIGTASLLLAQQGLLSGLSATTHPDYFAKFENICSMASQRDLSDRPDVIEARYVVNNLRFDLGNPDENPYIRRKSDARRPSNARKGSNAWKESNVRRESIAKRAAMKLGGLRVITSGGTGCGIDAALYLVSIMVSNESADEVARVMQHTWTKGVVVDGIDI